VDQPEKSSGNCNCVIETGPEIVLLDLAKSSIRQLDRRDNGTELPPHQGDVCRFYGDIGTGTDGDADIGLF